MIKLSQVSKLDGIKSWSLEAVTTCPGARDKSGQLVEVCRGCYAVGGNYRFPSVRNVRRHNRIDWQRDDWTDDMVHALKNERYFRWFDSGDIYTFELARKIHDVVVRTPWCKHWIPTRSYKIPHIRLVLEMIKREPNAVVRYSSDRVDEYDPKLHGSVVASSPESVPPGATLCEAYSREPASCNGCRACWDKSTKTIAYLAHGQGMRRLLREAA